MFDLTKLKKNIDNLRQLDEQAWDKICRGCGLCCLAKVIEEDHKIYFSHCTCGQFNLKSRGCNCYLKRLCQPNCQKLTLKHIIDGKLIPDSCAYVERIFGPAKFPAIIDWKNVIPVETLDGIDWTTITDNVIPSSVYWSARYNFGDKIFPGYSNISRALNEYIQKRK